MEEQLDYVFNLHMREGIRSDVVGATERATGEHPGIEGRRGRFADLVGFTKLGENLPPEEIGGVAGELAEMAARRRRAAGQAGQDDRRRGDAGGRRTPSALVEAAIELVARADEAREGFPQLRGGVACGPALNRGGDWYGRPGQHRLARDRRGPARQRAGHRASVHDGPGGRFNWSFAGQAQAEGREGRGSRCSARAGANRTARAAATPGLYGARSAKVEKL